MVLIVSMQHLGFEERQVEQERVWASRLFGAASRSSAAAKSFDMEPLKHENQIRRLINVIIHTQAHHSLDTSRTAWDSPSGIGLPVQQVQADWGTGQSNKPQDSDTV
jgi:hypothetical protein